MVSTGDSWYDIFDYGSMFSQQIVLPDLPHFEVKS